MSTTVVGINGAQESLLKKSLIDTLRDPDRSDDARLRAFKVLICLLQSGKKTIGEVLPVVIKSASVITEKSTKVRIKALEFLNNNFQLIQNPNTIGELIDLVADNFQARWDGGPSFSRITSGFFELLEKLIDFVAKEDPTSPVVLKFRQREEDIMNELVLFEGYAGLDSGLENTRLWLLNKLTLSKNVPSQDYCI